MNDIRFFSIAAHADSRLSEHDRHVMRVLDHHGIPESLDRLCELIKGTPRPYVFYAVARLEDLGWLERGLIR